MTEDLCLTSEAMGLGTGVNLAALLQVRDILARALPDGSLYGFTAEAGLPLGFAAGSKRK